MECQCLSHWYDSTPKKSRRKRDSNPGASALEADALTLGQWGGLTWRTTDYKPLMPSGPLMEWLWDFREEGKPKTLSHSWWSLEFCTIHGVISSQYHKSRLREMSTRSRVSNQDHGRCSPNALPLRQSITFSLMSISCQHGFVVFGNAHTCSTLLSKVFPKAALEANVAVWYTERSQAEPVASPLTLRPGGRRLC